MVRWVSWPLRGPWWQVVIIVVLLVPLMLTLLRQNNLGMVERREAVLAADKTGDKDRILAALRELQRYSAAHMNAETGAIYLQESYDRDAQAAITASQQATNPQAAVYQQAAVECQSRFRGGAASFQNDYVACVAERVAALAPAAVTQAQLPVPDLYRYSFASPKWSFDSAGISVFLLCLMLVALLLRLTGVITRQYLLKRRYQDIDRM